MIECIFANNCIYSPTFIGICIFIALFAFISIFFIHQYLNLTYSSYLSGFESFNNEIVINGYCQINRYLFRFYQIIYTLIMSVSFSMCFCLISKLYNNPFSFLDVCFLIIITICNLFIINIYLFKIGQLFDKKSNKEISSSIIRQNNLSMIIIQMYHDISAIIAITLGIITTIIVFIKNHYVMYISLIYIGMCLLTVGIRYFIDKKINNFGTYEKITCWSLYFIYALYSLVEFDIKFFITSCLVFSVVGFEIVTNNYNMTIHITNHQKYSCLNKTNNGIYYYENISFIDIFNFFLKNDFFSRLWFMIKLIYLKNNLIQYVLMHNDKFDDTKPHIFIEELYKNKDFIFIQ